jgi:diamine N-acetyltransferase
MEKKDSFAALQKSHQEQLLKMVAKGFYNELIKYGIQRQEVITVAGHLLDNVIQHNFSVDKNEEYYNRLFTLPDIRDEWSAGQKLGIANVAIRPLDLGLIPQVAAWLEKPGINESFIPPYPESEPALAAYFSHPPRQYFQIEYDGQPVGIIGAEHVDRESAKLEMRKLVGGGFRGKGIGKRATFLFLYFAFLILRMNKVYIYSDDINVRNLNLNNHFGFELEGVFFEDFCAQNKKHDIIRMGLLHSHWMEIFQARPASG